MQTKKCGEKGIEARDKSEKESENFRIGVLIQEALIKQKLTQQQLADKVGTTKNYTSRIGNNARDFRLSTLMCIIREGLGRKPKIIPERLAVCYVQNANNGYNSAWHNSQKLNTVP